MVDYTWVNKPTDQKDDYSDIVIPEKVDLDALIKLEKETFYRFGFEVDKSGLYATINYVNYEENASGKLKKMKNTGQFALKPRIVDKVVL